jgi:hypothetical protein
MGETTSRPFQLSFNAALKVEFQGSRVTSDGGLILVRYKRAFAECQGGSRTEKIGWVPPTEGVQAPKWKSQITQESTK